MSPFDWGVHDVRGANKNVRCLARIRHICQRYEPETLVTQNTGPDGTHRTLRIRRLNRALHEVADAKGLPVYAYSRIAVRQCFGAAAATKHLIAEIIVKHIPSFERYLPPKRKPWMSEHARMALFDAAALGLTHFRSVEEEA